MKSRIFRLGFLSLLAGLGMSGFAQAQCIKVGDPSCIPSTDARPSPIKVANEPQTTGSIPTPHGARRFVHNIVELHQRIRACWVPPSPRESWEGMEYTISVSFKRDGDVLGPARITYASPEAPMW